MMQYMILTVSVLVLSLCIGVKAESKGKELNYQLELPIASHARDGVNATLNAAKLEDMSIRADDKQHKEEALDAPVPAQTAACTQFRLSGTSYNTAIHGTYTLESGSYCGSKPVYRAYGYGQYVYLFYSSSAGHWAFYQTKCSTYGYVASVTTYASRPDYVTSWAEVDSLGYWVTNSYIRVTCTGTPTTPSPTPAPGCDSYELYGCKYKFGIHGWYSRTTYTCSSKPVYSRYSSSFGETVYLYYMYSSGLWAFSDTRCSSYSYVSSTSYQNNFPDEVVSWDEVDTWGLWYTNPDIGVKCSSNTANFNPLVVLILFVCASVSTW